MAPKFKRKDRAGQCVEGHDWWGPNQQVVGAGVSRAGRPKLPIRRLKRVVKRQRTIVGVVMREVQRKRELLNQGRMAPKAWDELSMWPERAERVRTQQTKDKNKLYALHAPEVECIGKGKARKPYDFDFR